MHVTPEVPRDNLTQVPTV